MKSSFVFAFCVLFLFSCKKELAPAAQEDQNKTARSLQRPHVLKIGDSYAGGIIIYFSNFLRTHGRVCATEDIGNYPWDLTVFDPQNPQNYNPHLVGGTSTGRDYGAANTTGIVQALGSGSYAAVMCRNYRGGGFVDWSLPSRDELDLVYDRVKVPGLSTFGGTYYWSSSEIDNKAVWCERFDTGEEVSTAWKNNVMSVRPTRGF